MKALRHKGLLLFLAPSALSTTASEYHAVANGRDTPDSGRCWNDVWRPLDGENAHNCGRAPLTPCVFSFTRLPIISATSCEP